MRVSIRLREPALSIAELVPGNGRLAAVRWSNLDLGARPSGYRWRAPSVINIQPLTTCINPHSIFVGTAVAVQIRSYLLRSGSHYPALRSPALRGKQLPFAVASCLEHCPNQAQYPTIRYSLGY